MPNPNDGSFQIVFDNEHGIKNVEVCIINSIGAVVFKSKNELRSRKIINTELPNGIYALIIITDKGIATKRFEVVN